MNFRKIYQFLWLLLALTVLGWTSLVQATQYDLRSGGSNAISGKGSSVTFLRKQIDFTKMPNSSATTVWTSGDTAKLFNIPANTKVMMINAYVDSAASATTSISLGDSSSATKYLNAKSINTAGVNWNSYNYTNPNYFMIPLAFSKADLTSSTSATAIPVSTINSATMIRMPFGGNIVAIGATGNANTTAGSVTFDATIDGSVTGLQAILNSTKQTSTTTAATYGAYPVNAGQSLGVKYTTSHDFAPTGSTDFTAMVYFMAGPNPNPLYAAADYLLLTLTGTPTTGKVTIVAECVQP